MSSWFPVTIALEFQQLSIPRYVVQHDRNPSSLVHFVARREVAKRLKRNCEVDVQSASLPGELQGVGWSDHWSFWQEGYAGVMVTDTALFRYPHYHEQTDTVDKIEFVRYANVVVGLAKTIVEFADAEK